MVVYMWGFPGRSAVKKLPVARDRGSVSGSGRSSGARHSSSILIHIVFSMEWSVPTPVFFPGECHGQRSLVGCSPWGHTESTQLKWLSSSSSSSSIGGVYVSVLLSHFIPPPPFPLLCPHLHSLSLRLYSWPANRLSCTIFLDSIYMH